MVPVYDCLSGFSKLLDDAQDLPRNPLVDHTKIASTRAIHDGQVVSVAQALP
jgi:hypothetical protein